MNILLINPFIHDFAAYDLWMRPHGLLKIAAALERAGHNISFIDCLDRKDPEIYKFYKREKPRQDEYDCGKFFKTQIEKPDEIKKIQRRFYRYGIPLPLFDKRLEAVQKPDLILVTSVMTYWYPGIAETIGIVKSHFSGVPVILGGIYPTLCPDHANKFSGADYVWGQVLNREFLNSFVKTENEIHDSRPDPMPLPAYHLLKNNNAAAIQTSCGCPFSCTYCASKLIAPEFFQRKVEDVIAELSHYKSLGIKNIAFYDDALLFKADSHFIPIMENVIQEKLDFYFHTPNGLHARYFTPKIASLMKSAGFKTIRLSLETTSAARQEKTGGKVTNEDLRKAVAYLKEAGIEPSTIDVYLLIGFPDQTLEEAKEDIKFVHSLGAKISLASYSAIPGTADWNEMVKAGKIPADLDPLWHNHTIFPSINKEFSVETVRQLRQETAKMNLK